MEEYTTIPKTPVSDFLVSKPGHALVGRSYLSAEMQSVHSSAPVDWVVDKQDHEKLKELHRY